LLFQLDTDKAIIRSAMECYVTGNGNGSLQCALRALTCNTEKCENVCQYMRWLGRDSNQVLPHKSQTQLRHEIWSLYINYLIRCSNLRPALLTAFVHLHSINTQKSERQAYKLTMQTTSQLQQVTSMHSVAISIFLWLLPLRCGLL
jgi:hypothetical protein